MNKLFIRMISILFAVVLSQNVSADIDPGTTTASHELEEAVAEIHEYLHDNYGQTFTSHGFEVSADELHGALHDYSAGSATEEDVVMKMEDVKQAWNTFRQSIIPAMVLNMGDDELDGLYAVVKDAYKEIRFLLRNTK